MDKKRNVMYYALQMNMGVAVNHIREISKMDGLYEEKSELFKDTQKAWWIAYREVCKLRDISLRFYEIAPPDWKNELISEHEYLGRLSTLEDTEKYMSAPPEGCGISLIKPKTMDEIVHSEMQEREAEENADDEDDCDKEN